MTGAPPRRSGAAALAAVLGAVALFFSPALLGGGQFLSGDTGRMHAPVKRWIAGELRRGHLPEWNPYLGLGAPVTAGAIDAVLHPFSLLLVALPFEAAFTLWVVLSYAVAAAGAFLWARRLGAGPPAAAAAGLAFALSGFLVSSSENLTFLTGLAALPAVLAAAHAFAEAPGPGRAALLALAAAFAASAGDPQSFGLLVLLLPAYAALLVEGEARWWRRALAGGAAAGVALVAAAPFLLPVAAWLPHSSRGEPLDQMEHLRWSLHPLRLLELAVPGLVGADPGELHAPVHEAFTADALTVKPWVASVHAGAATVALALLAAWRGRAGRALVLGAAAFAWMALGHHAGFGGLARHLPLLGGMRYWEKLAVWPALLLAAAAALGVEHLARERRPGRFPAAAAAAGGLLLASALGLALAAGPAARAIAGADPDRLQPAGALAGNLGTGAVAAGLALLALAGAAWLAGRPRLAAAAPALLAAVVGLELAASSSRAWRLSPAGLDRPPSPLADHLAALPGLQRVLTPFYDMARERELLPGLSPADSAADWFARNLHAAYNVGRGIGNFRNYLALVPARANRFDRRAGQDRLLPNVGLWGVAHVVAPLSPDRAAAMGLPPPLRVEAVDEALPAWLVAVPHRPRAYLAAQVASVDRRGAMEFALSADPASPRSVVEGPVPDGYAPPGGEAVLVADEGERLEVTTRTGGPALLVLNDAWAEGWTAEVDGAAAALVPANYLARGVWVPAGEHRVSFRYRTPLLREGLLLQAALGLSLLGWALRRRARG